MSLEKKKARSNFPTQCLLILAGLLAFVMARPSVTQAQKYSDWSTPVNLGAVINSSLSNQGPAISKDGLSLYFTSNRSGGLGGFDMYVSQRASADDSFRSPVPGSDCEYHSMKVIRRFHAMDTTFSFKASAPAGSGE